MHKPYFANLNGNELAQAIDDRVRSFYEEVDRTGQLSLWRKSHRYYYAIDENGVHEAKELRAKGEQGELTGLKANHYRNLLQHLLVLVTQQRPSFECRAINTDYKSQIQTILGRNILEYYLREQRMAKDFRRGAELMIYQSEAYVEVGWDEDAGDVVAHDPESGEVVHTGDVYLRVYGPRDTVRPCKANANGKVDWYILGRWENKYELAARHPHLAEKIMAAQSDHLNEDWYEYDYMAGELEREDMIRVYKFYHPRTKACPGGREAEAIDAETLLYAKALDDKDMPVYPALPYIKDGSSFGYSVAFDLLVVQEGIDLLYSTIISNQAAFGVQNIWMKPGSNIVESQLAGGLNIIESNEKPESINLTNTPAELFNFLKGLEQLGETLSGVNSVARGQPEASLKSGSALALVASQAVQFANGLSAAYVQLLEDVGTCVLKKLQKKAALPRAAVIAGKGNRSYVKDFTGEDLSSINRVIVDIGNPVSRTLSGRMEVASSLLEAQQITPQEYMMIIETGTLDVAVDEERSEEMLIDAENEALREGRPVIAVDTDSHVDHIKKHRCVLADPEARLDAALVQRTLAHIQEHITALETVKPQLLSILGQQPIAPDQPMQGQFAPQPNSAPQGPTPGEQMPVPPGGEALQAEMPRMPTPPTVSEDPAAVAAG